MMKQTILLTLLVGAACAQPPWVRAPEASFGGGGATQGEQHKRMEMMKMWHLTDALNLSEEEAQKFFPRYKALGEELKQIGEQQKALLEQIREKAENGEDIDKRDLDRIVKEVSELEQTRIERKQKFFEGLDDMLSPNQRARYLGFDLRFRKELREGIRDRHGPEGMKKRKKMGRMKRDRKRPRF